MRIHHVTVPARDPDRVANVLAEILGARVVPIPHPTGTLLVYAGDADGTAIAVWPGGACQAGRARPAADRPAAARGLAAPRVHQQRRLRRRPDPRGVRPRGMERRARTKRPPRPRFQPGARHDREPHQYRARRRRHARRVRGIRRGRPQDGGSAIISTVRHISLRVPQPGSTGAVSALVLYSHVTCTSDDAFILMGVL